MVCVIRFYFCKTSYIFYLRLLASWMP